MADFLPYTEHMLIQNSHNIYVEVCKNNNISKLTGNKLFFSNVQTIFNLLSRLCPH